MEQYKQLKSVIESKYKTLKDIVDSYGEATIPTEVLSRYYEFKNLIATIKEIDNDLNEN